MKTPVAVALIIAGSLVVMTSVFAETAYQEQVVALATSERARGTTIRSQLGETIQFCCWVTGTLMIGWAVLKSRASGNDA